MSVEDLGAELAGGVAVPGGVASLFERGATIRSDVGVGDVTVRFSLPPIGIPVIATGDAGSAAVLGPRSITFDILGWRLEDFMVALRALFADRVALLPTGQAAGSVELVLGTPEVVKASSSGVQAVYGVTASAPLAERQLYDIAVKGDDGTWQSIAPHAVYYRSSWHDFGIAHVTDIHIARRIDYFADRLEAAGRADAAATMVNWNDRFRGFIQYANHLHARGLLDVILATGDIIDYLFENEEDEAAGGNAWFARQILLGRAPSRRFPSPEELRVPIFVVPGNHDYRKWPYHLMSYLDLGLDVLGVDEVPVPQHANYRLSEEDALIAQGTPQAPKRSAENAARALEIEHDIPPFRRYLADQLNYVVRLGPHRIVMLDSGPDTGLPTNKVELALSKLEDLPLGLDVLGKVFGDLPEVKRTAIAGTPNSEGVTDKMLKLVVDTLAETPAGGLFMVGLHAPLFNVWAEEYPYFLRETQRTRQADQVHAWIARHDEASRESAAGPREHHPRWFASGSNPDDATYVMRGDPSDLLDFGTSRGAAHELLRALTGIDQSRRADLVLHGHIHRYNEFRLDEAGGELVYSMDFYTRNVPHYYPTRYVTAREWGSLIGGPPSDVTYVDVVDGAPENNQPTATVTETRYRNAVTVPPYPSPLAGAPDRHAWWAAHRPLVLQTEALGPFKNHEANLGGFRVLSVRGDLIDRIDHISIERLDTAGYQLEWEQAIETQSRRYFWHLSRSQEFSAPAAEGRPCGSLLSTGTEDIFYRDAAGQLLELWRDAAGQRGTGNLTAVASAPAASGDPSCYLDTGAGTVVVPYRGADGAIHSVYSTPGGTGHDALSGPIGAPTADSDPLGFYNQATGVHHVIYRAGGQLQALWWAHDSAAACDNLTAAAGAVDAQGNPCAYLDSVRGLNHVIYRGADDHVRSIYWSDGPAGTEDLSGVAQSPPASGDPVASYIHAANTHHIVYRSTDGHLHLLAWVGDALVTVLDLSAATGAPPAESDPAAWFSAGRNTQNVVFRDAAGHVHLLSWVLGGAPGHNDLTVAAYSPPAAGAPFGFTGRSHEHVVYRGADGQVHEIWWG